MTWCVIMLCLTRIIIIRGVDETTSGPIVPALDDI
jgi:hypothetical protein